MAGRYVLLCVAAARSAWLGDLARWSTTAALPIELVTAFSPAEARAVLGAGRPVSALVLDADASRPDRDLVALADDRGVPTLAVARQRAGRDWDALGIAAVLDPRIGRDDLAEVLARHAVTVTGDRAPSAIGGAGTVRLDDDEVARLVGVTGTGGAGASTVAMAAAQVLASEGGPVVLADGCRRADLAAYHDIGDVIPGLPELLDAHRGDRPDPQLITSLCHDAPARGYRVLLGVRRPRDWTTFRVPTVAAAVDGLRRSFDHVVVDLDPDAEGEAETGSFDVEERHAVTRCVVERADVVLAVGAPGLHGMLALVRLLHELVGAGADPERVQPVVNRCPATPAARAESTRALHELCGRAPATAAVGPPVFLRPLRRLEDLHRAGAALPERWCRPVATALRLHLGAPARSGVAAPAPVPLRPGELSVSLLDDPVGPSGATGAQDGPQRRDEVA